MQPPQIDKDRVRSKWIHWGFSCEHSVDPPGVVWHDCMHEVDRIVLLLSGSSLIELDGRTVWLRTGDEYVIPAGTRHTVRTCGHGPSRWLQGFRTMVASG
jgi:mannose-6-phosphate isomerase-like protein (cupin superfamily)